MTCFRQIHCEIPWPGVLNHGHEKSDVCAQSRVVEMIDMFSPNKDKQKRIVDNMLKAFSDKFRIPMVLAS